MGAAISNSVASQITTNSLTIANKYVSNCTSTGSQLFDLNVLNGCVANNNTVNISDVQVLNVACIQNATTKASMTSDIQAQIAQQTLAAAQSIGGPSLTIANTISNQATNAANSIVSAYTQKCVTDENQVTTITCSGQGSQFSGNVINVNNTQNAYNSCVANQSSSDTITSGIANAIKTQTSAKEANTLGGFVAIALIVLVIFGIFFIYSVQSFGWIIVIIIVLICISFIIYAVYAFTDKLYPFNQGSSSS
jgi:hypothetical protein